MTDHGDGNGDDGGDGHGSADREADTDPDGTGDRGEDDRPDREAYRRQVRAALPELADVDDEDLRERTVEAWVLGLDRGGWRSIEAIPYAWNIDSVTNVEHVRGVTQIAVASARIQRDLHGADPDLDVVRSAALLHDVGKCYEYTDHVDPDLVDPHPEYGGDVVPHSLSGYALAHEVGCPMAVKRAIPHVIGEVPDRSLEAELVKSANGASSNAITQAEMGISLDEWIDRYSQTS